MTTLYYNVYLIQVSTDNRQRKPTHITGMKYVYIYFGVYKHSSTSDKEFMQPPSATLSIVFLLIKHYLIIAVSTDKISYDYIII